LNYARPLFNILLQLTAAQRLLGTSTEGAFFSHVDYFRIARENEAAGAADASRAMLSASCSMIGLRR